MTCGKCGMTCGHSRKKRLCVISFALAWGLTFGLFMLFLGWLAWLSGHGLEMVRTVGSLYHGFTATFAGGVIGGLWGFLEGIILGGLIALFYNLFTCCCKMSCCSKVGQCECGSSQCNCNTKGATGTTQCSCSEGCQCGCSNSTKRNAESEVGSTRQF